MLYQTGGVTLAPFYDLLATVAYPDLSAKLAMKIAKRATLEEVGSTTWPEFAADVGLSAPFVRRRVVELGEAVNARAPVVAENPALIGLDPDAMARYSALIVSRAGRVAKTGAR